MRKSNDKIAVVKCYCHAESGKAMLLSDDGDEGNAQWVPKSQIVKCDIGRDEEGEVRMKEWIAEKCGFHCDDIVDVIE